MTISLPGSKKRGIAGLLGRKKTETVKPAAQQQLDPKQVAKLFQKGAAAEPELRPAKLNTLEKRERDSISDLRGALYSKR